MYRGNIKVILLFIFIIILMGFSAMMFTFEKDAHNIKEKAYDSVKQKMENEKGDVVEKITDTGRQKVGEALQDVGEKILLQKYETPGYFGNYDQNDLQKYEYAILFFTAEWCPSCVAVEKNIAQRSAYIPPHIAIMMIDYDDQEMKEKYNVNQQHTFILLDENGDEVKRWTNSETLGGIISNVK
jgi:thiol-disulfide isomerase/thioredoxin